VRDSPPLPFFPLGNLDSASTSPYVTLNLLSQPPPHSFTISSSPAGVLFLESRRRFLRHGRVHERTPRAGALEEVGAHRALCPLCRPLLREVFLLLLYNFPISWVSSPTLHLTSSPHLKFPFFPSPRATASQALRMHFLDDVSPESDRERGRVRECEEGFR
jgi:hypothetical protein